MAMALVLQINQPVENKLISDLEFIYLAALVDEFVVKESSHLLHGSLA